MWVIDDKSGSLLANTRLGIYGVAIIVNASSILDVGGGPGSVSDIFSINY